MEEFNEFSRLLWRHYFQLLTPEEQRELDKRIENKDGIRVFDSVTSEKEYNKAADYIDSLDKATKLADVKGKLRFTVTANASFNPNLSRIKWRRPYSVAASVTGLLIMAVYFAIIYFSIRIKSTDKIVQQQEIMPGSNKAMLTLADGSVIVLESTAGDTIPIDGSNIVVKQNGSLIYLPGNNSTGYHTLTTPRGGTYSTILPDGSKAWLNASSSLKYAASMAGDVRKVMVSGEVYFEVSRKADDRPFIVEVRDRNMQIEVLGTEFNINAYPEEPAIKTSLFKGSIKIIANGKTAMLLPAQEAQFYGNALTIVDLDAAGLMASRAWKEGKFDFKVADLRSIMLQIGRWYDIDVETDDKAILGRNFGGGLSRDTNLSVVLRVLELNDIHFKLDGRKLVLVQK